MRVKLMVVCVAAVLIGALSGCAGLPSTSKGSRPSAEPSSTPTSTTATSALVASDCGWKGVFGSPKGDSSLGFTMLAQGFFTDDLDGEADWTVKSWIYAHPNAKVLPVLDYGTSPDGTRMQWVWLVDGDECLNQQLVREGLCTADDMRRPDELPLLVSQQRYDELTAPLDELEAAAKREFLGVWE